MFFSHDLGPPAHRHSALLLTEVNRKMCFHYHGGVGGGLHGYEAFSLPKSQLVESSLDAFGRTAMGFIEVDNCLRRYYKSRSDNTPVCHPFLWTRTTLETAGIIFDSNGPNELRSVLLDSDSPIRVRGHHK